MIKLNTSRVIFTDDPHAYHLGVKELKGITGVLSRQIFRDKYFNVSPEVLKKAAERGTLIHEQCRAVDVIGLAVSDEAVAYASIKEEYGLVNVANEYTVSDEKNYASNIDMVAEYNGKVIIADFKTTSHFDIEYLSWQLSIYKYLFEIQNPHIEVGGLMGIWLPQSRYGKPRAEWIPEKPRAEVIKLLDADANGESYTPPLVRGLPPEVEVIRAQIFEVGQRLKEAKAQMDDLHDALHKAMEKHDVKKWETDDFTITRVLPTVKKTFDAKRFKEEHGDLYDEYQKDTVVKGGVRITMKK